MADLSSPSSQELRQQPSFAYLNPSSLSMGESGFGTKLGFSERGYEIFPGYEVSTLRGEEYGEEPVVKIYLGGQPRVRTILKSWNSTALTQAFPGWFESGKSNVRFPGDIESGTRLDTDTYAARLFVVPIDSGEFNNVFLAQYAIPNMPASDRLSKSLGDPTVLPIIWDLFRRDGGSDKRRSWFEGALADAVLI